MLEQLLLKIVPQVLDKWLGNVVVRPPVTFAAQSILLSQEIIDSVPILQSMVSYHIPAIATLVDTHPKAQEMIEAWFAKCLELRGVNQCQLR